MTDKDIIEYITEYKKNHKRFTVHALPKDLIEYIKNRYTDSSSLKESVYRIFNNIEVRPKCSCGKNLPYKNINCGYNHHCSQRCAQKDPDMSQKIYNTKIAKYGSGTNVEKIKQTMIERYGYAHALQNPELMAKRNQTMINRYGDPSYRDKEKTKRTCLEKYGVEYYFQSDDIKKKTIEKLGVDNYWKTDKCKKEVSEYHKKHKDELTAKKKKTYLERYGVEWLSQNKDFYANMDKESWLRHQHETKRKNHTFKTSKREETSYELLIEKFGNDNIIRQYVSEKYPFACDFYIINLDLYIECNYHWTHGGKPYEGIEDDRKLVKEWESSNSQYYINAIGTWTIRDVAKRNTAKENNLNWIEFWNINELKKWIDNYGI